MTIIAKLLVISLDDYEEDIYKQIISLFPEKNQVAVLNAEPIIQKDELQIFPKSRTVRKNGSLLSLTKIEYDILHLLAVHPGQVFSKEQIYEAVWEHEYVYDGGNIVAHINKLRNKVEDNTSQPVYIQTVWGIGYRFNGDLK